MPHGMGEKELFQRALELPVDERSAYLKAQCDDPELRARVGRLLEAHDAAGSDFPAEVLRTTARTTPLPTIPDQLGEFTLVEQIGVGGMGVVYRATDATLRRPVALKVLSPQLAFSEHDRARFKHEATVAARLNHPGIVSVYTFGEASGLLYIATELVNGQVLDDWMLEHSKETAKGAGIPVHDAAQIVARVADALEHAHRMDVIHRDVKPSNILIATNGVPRLTDFGIAKVLTDETRITSAGAGTVRYMSPEQASAIEVDVDLRTDIFSLGIVLYEMLVGRTPFIGETREQVLRCLRFDDPTPPRSIRTEIPIDLQTICLKALEKKPRDRYQSAAHFAADLDSFQSGKPILARPPSVTRKLWIRLYSRRILLVGMLIAIIGIIVGAVWRERANDRRPILHLAGLPPQATVSVLRFDLESGSFLPIRSLTSGTRRIRLDPAYYRFVIYHEGDFAELSRVLHAAETTTLRPRLVPTTEVVTNMVLIPSGADSNFVMGAAEKQAYVESVESLGAFWIDATEVSNAEYRRFVEATDHPPPALWGEAMAAYDESWDSLPVVNISFLDAQAYAEWVGKRLPTHLEWMRAARGVDGRLFPWGDEGYDDPAMIQARANAWRDEIGTMTRWSGSERTRQSYLRGVLPVDSRSNEDVTDNNLLHMLGNVAEWTESSPDGSIFGLPRDRPMHRLFAGGAWGDHPTAKKTLASLSMDHVSGVLLGRGFRCAKTAEPTPLR